MKKNTDATMTITNTMPEVIVVSLRVGQVTLATSRRTSRANSAGFFFAIAGGPPVSLKCSLRHQGAGIKSGSSYFRSSWPAGRWQEWRGSNPQPPVLETGALPIELHSYDARPPDDCSYMVATASRHH